MRRNILVTTISTLCWGLLLTFFVRTVPVGLHLNTTDPIKVSAITVFNNGQEEYCCENVKSESDLTFYINRSARTFYFRFYSPNSTNGIVALKSVNLFFVPVISATMIPNFNMRTKLYDKLPENNQPLMLHYKSGDIFEFPNVFPFICHIANAITLFIAWGPLAILLAILFYTLLGKHVFTKIENVFDNKPLFVSILCCSILLAMPPPVSMPVPGLDSSWEWLFNKFAFSDLIGSDFIFTYGPLGFLIKPQFSLINIYLGIVTNALFSGIFALMIWWLYKYGHKSMERRAGIILLALWSITWPNGMEWKWFIVSIMACFLALDREDLPQRRRCLLFVLAATTAVLQTFIKFSSCVMILSQQVFMIAIYAIFIKKKLRRGVFTYAFSLITSIGIGTYFLFPDLHAFQKWLIGSLQISSGYNLYMGGDKSWCELSFIPALIIGVSLIVLYGKNGRARRATKWVLFVPTIFFAFKYAVVRQNIIPLSLLLSTWACLCLCINSISLRRVFLVIIFCLGLSSSMSILMYGKGFALALSLNNLLSMAKPATMLQRANKQSAPIISKATLPSQWRQRIGANNIMIIGEEMGPAMAGELNLIPFPATQTYSAYTPYLDKLCAETILTLKDPPEYILVPANPRTFDSRNIYFDNPRLWRAVRTAYEYVDSSNAFVLLQHRKKVNQKSYTGIQFDLKRSFLGKIQSLLLRTPMTVAYFKFKDGSEYSCSANIEVLNGTKIPDMLPVAPSDVPVFFGAEGSCPIVSSISIKPWHTSIVKGKLSYQ